MMKSKKGQTAAVAGVSSLIGLGIVLVIYGIVTSFGADIVTDIQGDFTASSIEYNISQQALEGIDETSQKLPTVSRVAVAAIIIGIILAAFGGFLGFRLR